MGPGELIQAAAMARRFYLQGRSKVQIAEEFGVSRFRVARVLDRALETGLVRIDIRTPDELDAERSDALRARYGLHHAVVVTAHEEEGLPDPVGLGGSAARLIGELVEDGGVLGLAWGNAVNATAGALTALPPCTVVQLTGVYDGGPRGTGTPGVPPGQAGSVESVRRAARIAGGDALPIYAPLVLPDTGTAATLRAQPGVARVFAEFPRVRVAVVSIGAWGPGVSTVYDSLGSEEREGYAESGVVGEMAGLLFDAGGALVAPELTDRCIAIGADALDAVPEVLAIAGGVRKARAIGAALRSGLITSLVTDSAVAERLLAE
jgi:DNA-binding transcriptional regulator LsrR (DeoR family)